MKRLDDYTLLISSPDDGTDTGGLYRWSSDGVELITKGHHMGLCSVPTPQGMTYYQVRGGNRIVKLNEAFEVQKTCHFKVGNPDLHHIKFNFARGTLYTVATGFNALIELALNLNVIRQIYFQSPVETVGDVYHFNGAFAYGHDTYLVTRFSNHNEFMGWKNQKTGEGSLQLWNWRRNTVEDIYTGLDKPHHPVLVDNMYGVLDSQKSELVLGEERIYLGGGFGRGLTNVNEDILLAGVCWDRHPSHSIYPHHDQIATAHLIVLNKKTKDYEKIELPMKSIYDIVVEVPHG